SDARWLTPEEQRAIEEAVRAEQEEIRASSHQTLGPALVSGRVWLLAIIYFTIVISFYGISLWLPQIVQSFADVGDLKIGFLSAIPYAAAAVGMVIVASQSDRSGERGIYVAVSALAGAAGFLAASSLHGGAASLAALSLAAFGVWSTLGPFWTFPPRFLVGPAAAGGIALINSVGNVGGFAGPYLLGYIRDHTGSFAWGLRALAGSLIVTAALALTVRRTIRGG
ncbi:MAG TPA: MFS transporter, partial [Vicinamibacterales bacterium]|nr:MFS transporter [Vicinamibacterales bacterium]